MYSILANNKNASGDYPGKGKELMQEIKLRDFLDLEICVDISDDVCESLYIAFDGPCHLTEAGKAEFEPIMDLPVYFNEAKCWASIHVDDVEGVWQKKLRLAKKLFVGFAGYISDTEYTRLFKED